MRHIAVPLEPNCVNTQLNSTVAGNFLEVIL